VHRPDLPQNSQILKTDFTEKYFISVQVIEKRDLFCYNRCVWAINIDLLYSAASEQQMELKAMTKEFQLESHL